MITKKRVSAASLALVLVAGLGLLAAPAHASTTLSSSDESSMRDTWNQYGVSAATQDALVAEYNSGQPWDSMSDTATPVATADASSSTPGQITTVYTYADGSISVISVDRAYPMPTNTTGAQPQAKITGCTTLSSSHYDITERCTAYANVVVAQFTYTATFHAVQGQSTTITDHSGLTYQSFGGTASSPYVRTVRSSATSAGPASVQGGLVFNAYGGFATKSYFLVFRVTGTSPSVYSN